MQDPTDFDMVPGSTLDDYAPVDSPEYMPVAEVEPLQYPAPPQVPAYDFTTPAGAARAPQQAQQYNSQVEAFGAKLRANREANKKREEAAQIRAENAQKRMTARQTGAQFQADATSRLQPVIDPVTGKQRFTESTSPVRYTETGEPFQVKTTETGNREILNPDANAPIRENPNDPNDRFLYRQNQYKEWEPIDPDEALTSGEPRMVIAASKTLHARKIKDLDTQRAEISLRLKDPARPSRLTPNTRTELEQIIAARSEPAEKPQTKRGMFGGVDAEATARLEAEWKQGEDARIAQVTQAQQALAADDERQTFEAQSYELEKALFEEKQGGPAAFLKRRREEIAKGISTGSEEDAKTQATTVADQLQDRSQSIADQRDAIQERAKELDAESKRGATAERMAEIVAERQKLNSDWNALSNQATAVQEEAQNIDTALQERTARQQKTQQEAAQRRQALARQQTIQQRPAMAQVFDKIDATEADIQARRDKVEAMPDSPVKAAALRALDDDASNKRAEIQREMGVALGDVKSLNPAEWDEADKAAFASLDPEKKRAISQAWMQEKLVRDIQTRRNEIRDEQFKAPENWQSLSMDQKRAIQEEFATRKIDTLRAFDNTESRKSPDRKAIIDELTGIEPGGFRAQLSRQLNGRVRTAAAASGLALSAVGTGALDIATAVQSALGADPDDTWTRQMSSGIRDYYDSAMDDDYRNAAFTNIVSGLSSALSFMAPVSAVGKIASITGAGSKVGGFLTKIIPALRNKRTAEQVGQMGSQLIGAAITGAVMNGGAAYGEALDMGLSKPQSFARLGVGLGLGLTEAAGVGGVLARLDRLGKGSVSKFFIEVTKQGVEEGLQEFTQTAGTDLMDLLILDDGDPRKKSMDQIIADATEAGLWGAVTGVLFTMMVSAAARRDRRNAGLPEDPEFNQPSIKIGPNDASTPGTVRNPEDIASAMAEIDAMPSGPSVVAQLEEQRKSATDPEQIAQIDAQIAEAARIEPAKMPPEAKQDLARALVKIATGEVTSLDQLSAAEQTAVSMAKTRAGTAFVEQTDSGMTVITDPALGWLESVAPAARALVTMDEAQVKAFADKKSAPPIPQGDARQLTEREAKTIDPRMVEAMAKNNGISEADAALIIIHELRNNPAKEGEKPLAILKRINDAFLAQGGATKITEITAAIRAQEEIQTRETDTLTEQAVTALESERGAPVTDAERATLRTILDRLVPAIRNWNSIAKNIAISPVFEKSAGVQVQVETGTLTINVADLMLPSNIEALLSKGDRPAAIIFHEVIHIVQIGQAVAEMKAKGEVGSNADLASRYFAQIWDSLPKSLKRALNKVYAHGKPNVTGTIGGAEFMRMLVQGEIGIDATGRIVDGKGAQLDEQLTSKEFLSKIRKGLRVLIAYINDIKGKLIKAGLPQEYIDAIESSRAQTIKTLREVQKAADASNSAAYQKEYELQLTKHSGATGQAGPGSTGRTDRTDGERSKSGREDGQGARNDSGAVEDISTSDVRTGTEGKGSESDAQKELTGAGKTKPRKDTHKFVRRKTANNGQPTVVFADSMGVEYSVPDRDAMPDGADSAQGKHVVLWGDYSGTFTISAEGDPTQETRNRFSPDEVFYKATDDLTGRSMAVQASDIQRFAEQPSYISEDGRLTPLAARKSMADNNAGWKPRPASQQTFTNKRKEPAQSDNVANVFKKTKAKAKELSDAEKAAKEEAEMRADMEGNLRNVGNEQGYELIEALEIAGGLPSKENPNRTTLLGELDRVLSAARSKVNKGGSAFTGRIFRRDANNLDQTRQVLEGYGFFFATPADMLEAIENRLTTGTQQYGNPEASGESALQSRSADVTDRDTDYLAAVKRGDTVAAQRMVDEATSSPEWHDAKHGTPETTPITIFGRRGALTGANSAKKAFFFSDAAAVTDTYRMQNRGEPDSDAINRWVDTLTDNQVAILLPQNRRFVIDSDFMREYARDTLKEELADYTNEIGEDIRYTLDDVVGVAKANKIPVPVELDPSNIGRTYNVKLRIANPYRFTAEDVESDGMDSIIDNAIAGGHDGIISRDRVADAFVGFDNKNPPAGIIYAVFEPSQIKSADPATYYPERHPRAGEPIALSERFNPESNSILQSRSADISNDETPVDASAARAYAINAGASNVEEAANGITRTLQFTATGRVGESGSYVQSDLFGGPETESAGTTAIAPGQAAAAALRKANAGKDGQAGVASADLIAGLQGDWKALAREIDAKGRASSIYSDLVTNRIPSWDVTGTKIEGPEDVMAVMQPIRSPYFESLKVMVMDGNNNVAFSQIVHVGALAESIADPRRIFSALVRMRESAGKNYNNIIISHNHPSGDPSPSTADINLQKRLNEIAKVVGFKVSDHVITNGENYFSFRDSGLISTASISKGYTPKKDTGTKPKPNDPLAIAPWEAIRRSKLSSLNGSDKLAKAAKFLRNGNPDSAHILYLNTKLKLTAIERISLSDYRDNAKRNQIILSGMAREGGYGFSIEAPGSQPTSQDLEIQRNVSKFASLSFMHAVDIVLTNDNAGQSNPYFSFREAGLMEAPSAYNAQAESQVDESSPNPGRATPLDANAPTVTASNATITGPTTFVLQSRPAYHGTPHEIDPAKGFRLDRIGTGEGAQAYGWGLYFAENRKVAEEYRDSLSTSYGQYGRLYSVDGLPAPEAGWSENNPALAAAAGYGAGAGLEGFITSWESFKKQNSTNPLAIQTADKYIADAEKLKGKSVEVREKIGSLYTVELDVETDQLLDWDKPLGEQSEKVRDLLNIPPGYESFTGAESYDIWRREFGGIKEASQWLNQKGIPGIRFLDQGSRYQADFFSAFSTKKAAQAKADELTGSGYQNAKIKLDTTTDKQNPWELRMDAPQGTYNYVIFDESKIKITEKNGQPVTLQQAQETSFKSRSADIANENQLELDFEAAARDASKTPAQRLKENASLIGQVAAKFANMPGYDRDEATQRVRIAIVRASQAYDGARGIPFEALARTVATNELRSMYRQNMRQATRFPASMDDPVGEDGASTRGDLTPDTSSRSPLQSTADNEASEMVDRMIANLPDRLRLAVEGFQAGKNGEQIADEMGITRQGVNNLQKAAFERMRRMLGEQGVTTTDDVVQVLKSRPADVTDRDADYMKAVEAGDMETAQRMVDDAAKAAGYVVGKGHHGTADPITEFNKNERGRTTDSASAKRGFFFAKHKDVADGYADFARPSELDSLKRKYQQLEKQAQRIGTNDAWNSYYDAYAAYEDAEISYSRDERTPNIVTAYLAIENPLIYDYKGADFRDESYDSIIKQALKAKNDGVILQNTFDGVGDPGGVRNPMTDIYVVFDPNQIKSADPVTRDEQGNVIPLSQRFNPASNSILQSAPVDPNSATDEDPIDALLRELEQDIDFDAAFDMQTAANAEQVAGGKQTIGRPDLARGADNADVRGMDAYYTAKFVPETESKWEQEATEMLANDYEGTRKQIELLGLTGQAIPSPAMVVAANRIADDLRARMNETGSEEDRKAFNRFWYSKRKSGSEWGRVGRAMRDMFKTPAMRYREFLIDMVTEPSVKAQRKIDAAPTEADQSARIADLERKLKLAIAQANAIQRNAIAKELEAERKVPTKETIIDAEMAALLEKLQKAGISPEDILQDRAKLSLKNKKIMDDFTALFAASPSKDGDAKRRAFALLRKNKSFKDISTTTGLTEDAVRKLKTDFVAQMRRDHFGKFLAGMNADGEMDISDTKVKPEKADRVFKEWLQKLGIVDDAKQGRPKFNIEDPAHVMRMARTIQSVKNATVLDMAYEWWIMNILSGLQTQVVNIGGNTIATAWDMTLQRSVEASLNLMIKDSKSAQLGEFQHLAKGLIPGIVKGWKEGVKSWSAENDFFENTVLGTPIELNNFDKAGNVRSAIPGKAGRVIRVPGRALLFADAIFKTAIGQMEAGAQAYRIAKAEGLTGQKMSDRIALLTKTRGQVIAENLAAAAPSGEMVQWFADHLLKRDPTLDIDALLTDKTSMAWELAREQAALEAAKAKGWKDDAWQIAVTKAKELTFQTDLQNNQDVETAQKQGNAQARTNVLESGAKYVQQAARTSKLLGFFFPFVRTPYNIFRMGLRKSPLGSVNLAYQLGRGLVGMREGQPFLRTNPTFARDVAEQMIAWGAFMALYAAAQGDEDDDNKMLLITGSQPYNLTRRGIRDLNDRAYGGTYMIRIGGRDGIKIPYGRMEPMGTVLGTVIDMIRMHKSPSTSPEKLDAFWGFLLSQAKDQTFLQGFASITEILEGSRAPVAGFNRGLMQAIVPNIIRQPLRNLDDYVRESRTAGLDYQLFPSGDNAAERITIYGKPIEKGWNPIGRLFINSPLKTDERLNAADAMLLKWNTRNPGEAYAPEPPRPVIRINGEDREMTPYEFNRFSMLSGKYLMEQIQLRITPAVIANPTEEDIEWLRRAVSKSRSDAKEMIFPGSR